MFCRYPVMLRNADNKTDLSIKDDAVQKSSSRRLLLFQSRLSNETFASIAQLPIQVESMAMRYRSSD